MAQQPRIVHVYHTATANRIEYAYALLFSLMRRSFIPPAKAERGALEYIIPEGTYLELASHGLLDAPYQNVLIRLVTITGNGEEIGIASWTWNIYFSRNWERGCPAIIVDFVKARPPPFGYPRIDYNKVYTMDDIQAIVRYGTCGNFEEIERQFKPI